MTSLFSELKRRNVIRVAIFYVVSAWLLLQIVDLIFEVLLVPDWTLRFIFGLLVAAFPFVLFLAWAYEVTPEGIKREKEVDRSQSITGQTGRKLDIAVIVVVLAGIVVAVSGRMLPGDQVLETPSAGYEGDRAASRSVPSGRATGGEPYGEAANRSVPGGRADDDRKSIAVLPFDNFSEDAGNAFFASGVHEDLLTHLAKIDDLKVISRTSVEQYNDNRPPIAEIAAALGVGHIVEGSVRRAGDRVRVTAQLIDAATDEHLWAESFDRNLNDVFAIQTEIARAIARALEATLSDAEEALISTVPTENMSAYDLYLKGRELASAGYKRQGFEEAEALLEQAIRLDPDFALAHAMLSRVHGSMVWWWDRSESRERAAREAAERAIELNPELPETRAALANYYYRVELDFQRAIEELEAAHERAPGNADVLYDMGLTYRRLGRWPEAATSIRESVELDPANPVRSQELALTLSMMGRFDNALAVMEPLQREYPGNLAFALTKADILLRGFGDTRGALALVGNRRLTGSGYTLGRATIIYRMTREWEKLIDLGEDPSARALTRGTNTESVLEEILGFAYQHLGDEAKARDHFERAVIVAETEMAAEGHPFAATARTFALSALDRHDEAIAAIEEALDRDINAFNEPGVRAVRAWALAQSGQTTVALDELEVLVDTPAGPSRWELRLDPRWDFLRGDERFRQLTAVEATIR